MENIQKLKGDPLGKYFVFGKKVSQCGKKSETNINWMKFEETFNSDVSQNFQKIPKKSSLSCPGGRFLSHSTVFVNKRSTTTLNTAVNYLNWHISSTLLHIKNENEETGSNVQTFLMIRTKITLTIRLRNEITIRYDNN